MRYREQGSNDRHKLKSNTSNHMSTILTGLKAGTVYEVEVAYVIPTIGLYSPPVLVQTFDGEPLTYNIYNTTTMVAFRYDVS